MKHLETFKGKFCPIATNDLSEGAKMIIGKIIIWCAAWMIEKGKYKGQWALTPYELLKVPIGWVPACDVVIEKEVD